jgi:uncharacterized protein (DUF2235 family)
LKALLINNDKQETYYLEGIGTAGLDYKRLVDAVLALTFKEKVIRGYRWLVRTYEKRDRIFLFGFSRGAYEARVISGMIEKVGLLKLTDDPDVDLKRALEAYQVYTAKGYPVADIDARCSAFKRLHSHPDVRTHFVGGYCVFHWIHKRTKSSYYS